jgi:thiosulfate dehydrogenase (quinone) large subunit
MGFVFLWAFLHKTFGLVYATQSENAWISGSSPSRGVPVERRRRPAREHLLQLGRRRLGLAVQRGLAGIGVAVILSVGLRLAAVSGAIMTLMWAAEWPLAEPPPASRRCRPSERPT